MNTKQFDGHTPGPWHEILMQGDEYNNGYDDLQERGFNEAAQDLITAAPDLLAEVKRLREQIVDMIVSMDNYYIRDVQHAAGSLRDMIGYYEDEEE